MESVIFLSPHLDDVVFSCSGLIQTVLAHGGQVRVATVFSRTLNQERIEEDVRACAYLNVEHQHLEFLDAPIRRQQPEVLFQDLEFEKPTIEALTAALINLQNAYPNSLFVAPLGVGWHVDHLVVHEAARAALPPEQLWYYEEAPYRYVGGQTLLRMSKASTEQVLICAQALKNCGYIQKYKSDWSLEYIQSTLSGPLTNNVEKKLRKVYEVQMTAELAQKSNQAGQFYSSQLDFFQSAEAGMVENYYCDSEL